MQKWSRLVLVLYLDNDAMCLQENRKLYCTTKRNFLAYCEEFYISVFQKYAFLKQRKFKTNLYFLGVNFGSE